MKPVFLALLAAIVLVADARPARADGPAATNLPAMCKVMTSERVKGNRWPFGGGDERFCTVRGGDREAAMSTVEYNKGMHRALRFACKGKREYLFQFMSALSNCNGGTRSFVARPAGNGCEMKVEETGEVIRVGGAPLDELKELALTANPFTLIALKVMMPDALGVFLAEAVDCFPADSSARSAILGTVDGTARD